MSRILVFCIYDVIFKMYTRLKEMTIKKLVVSNSTTNLLLKLLEPKHKLQFEILGLVVYLYFRLISIKYLITL